LLFVLSIVSVALAANSFQGVWQLEYPTVETTSYIYFCADDIRVTGLFNEQTIFVGEPNADTITGYFYEGYSESGCTYGSFQFNLGVGGTSFSGYVFCGEGPNYDNVIEWSAKIVSTQAPTVIECASIADFNSFTVDGFWIGATNGSANLDICGFDDYVAEASGTDGSYYYGSSAQDGRIFFGVKLTPNGDGVLPGSALVYVDINGDLHTIWWAGVSTYYPRDPIYLRNSHVHSYDTYNFIKGTSGQSCNANSGIALEDANYYFDPVYFQNYYVINSASYITVPLLLILCAVGLF